MEGLHPAFLEQYQFDEAVMQEKKRMERLYQVDIQLNISEVKFDKVIEKQLFRIIQEVLHNAIRHGKASIIQVKLTVHKRQIRLVIIDNGIGFDPNNLPASSRQHGFGLVSLYERVALINGHLQLSSRVNEGTKIVIILPYKKVDNKT